MILILNSGFYCDNKYFGFATKENEYILDFRLHKIAKENNMIHAIQLLTFASLYPDLISNELNWNRAEVINATNQLRIEINLSTNISTTGVSMTADEARRLNDEYALSLQLDSVSIEEKIRQAAKSGKALIKIDLKKIEYSYRTRVFDRIKRDFSERGFKVERSTSNGYADMRDTQTTGRFYDDAVISW